MVVAGKGIFTNINVDAPYIYLERSVTTHVPLADDLLPISLATLPLTSTVGVNVYLKTRPSEPPLLFSAAHNPISRQHFEDLIETGSSKLFIHRQDRELYKQAVQNCWQTLLLDRSFPILKRLIAVHELTREALHEHFRSRDTDKIVQCCAYYATNLVGVLGDDPVSLAQLGDVLHHDHRPETHATNVAAYAALLARALGFPTNELVQLTAGALLHDVGMLDIDSILLNKPGRLLDCERRTLQAHPALGMQRLIDRTDLVEGVAMMIYQHHERLNGSGYPVGVSGKEIHPWSQLCSIVDVYDGLTSGRPHRQALSSQTTLAVLERGAGSEFDREMVTCWRQIVLN